MKLFKNILLITLHVIDPLQPVRKISFGSFPILTMSKLLGNGQSYLFFRSVACASAKASATRGWL